MAVEMSNEVRDFLEEAARVSKAIEETGPKVVEKADKKKKD